MPARIDVLARKNSRSRRSRIESRRRESSVAHARPWQSGEGKTVRKLIVVFLVLSVSPVLARDGIVVAAKGQQYLYHVRDEAEVMLRCGAGVLGCFGKRTHSRVIEIWLVDSLSVAFYLCGRIDGHDEQELAKLSKFLHNEPAPKPLCFADRMHDGPNNAGRLMTTEEWFVSGGIAPAPTGESAMLWGSITDTALAPLQGTIVVRDMSNEIVALLRADRDGEFQARLPINLYSVRLQLDDGRNEGTFVLALGTRGQAVEWIVGLTE